MLFGSSILSFSLAAVHLFLGFTSVAKASSPQCERINGKYFSVVGEPCEIELDADREARFFFEGDPADRIGVSFLQCTGKKPQLLYTELQVADGTEVFSEVSVRPGCLMLHRPLEDGSEAYSKEVCSHPERKWGEEEANMVGHERKIYINETKVIVANVGNDTTTVELVMFTTEVPAPSSALSLWHGVEQSGELNGLILSVLVEFTWNRLEFCEDRRCMVEAWLTSWSADLPTVFLCLAEQGERIFVDKFRSNGELNNVVEADIELPNEFPYVVTVVLSHNATPNSTSALMRVNQEVLYQGLAMDGDLYAYPSGAFRTFESSPITALATLLVAVFGMRKVLATM